jgi:hypothetical protein
MDPPESETVKKRAREDLIPVPVAPVVEPLIGFPVYEFLKLVAVADNRR